ncbi:MAG: hypothetical protein AB2669_08115 [Candidatus Thiodiazotropha endolucinida]|nr:hypothetical protein [Candidatus Thiodiazotropha taylori]MCW4250162.1 hypothetical protein [Candidatus Thiodiazotropha endolucinida]MCG7883547.1 hypothetical protein [Candidatus Thiodiazotropha taylori]MCG8058718.1 hypothetical protein [Candidatus Thiodiazotropha taylori]MCG8104609.1 hypothetical protein [Candidatus Thiodiazotropha taylori]
MKGEEMPIPFKKTLLVAMAATVLTACKSEPMSLQIAHLNDTHSHFDEQVLQIGLPNEEQLWDENKVSSMKI